MSCPSQPVLLLVATKTIDQDQCLARIIIKKPGKKARELPGLISTETHAQSVIRAASAMVSLCLQRLEPMRLILPDRTVVELIQGSTVAKGRRLGQKVADIRHKIHTQGAPITIEYGTLWSTLGMSPDDLDLW